MAKLYRSREGNVTGVDTKTQLTTLASETAPGPLLVPAGTKKLLAVIAVAICDNSVAADGGYLIRLEGPGLQEGPETLAIGASGVAVATGGQGSVKAQRYELDIPVVPSNEILIFGENTGEDTGTTNIGVTLEFVT